MSGDGPPRDLVGYGRHRPRADWPGDARVAVQLVLNYEEGAERSVLEGDQHAEVFLTDLSEPPAHPARHMSVESLYEYGARAGVWRILRELEDRGLAATLFAVATALERNSDVGVAAGELGHEVACHGWRWLDYQEVDEATERSHMARAVATIERLTGERPLGWYTGRDSPRTRRLVAESGGFLYDSDSYADDLPYWTSVEKADGSCVPHLVVPYALDTNDMRFALPHGFPNGDTFFAYLRDAFDVLYSEGEERPAMMSVGMHCRLLGRPGRFRALQHFLDHVQRHDRVWVCRRVDIARHWIERHPYPVQP